MNTNGSDALSTFVDANCISLGIKMTAGGATAFLSGDINNLCGAEDALASELGHVDFLKLGRHGFNNSNSIGYIKALSPKFVFQTGRYSTMREGFVRALGDWLAVLFERRCRQRRFCGLRGFFIVGWRHDQWRVLHSAFGRELELWGALVAPSPVIVMRTRYLIWLFFPGGPLSICLTMRL